MPSIYNSRVRPWDTGTTFSPFFRDLFNEVAEGVYRFDEIEAQLVRVINEPQMPPESVEVPEQHFPVIIGTTTSEGFPKEYEWVEAQLVGGTSYGPLEDGRNSTDDGLAINRVELLSGFGVDVGPYGQDLTSGNSTLTVLAVASGSPVEMILEKNDSDITVPVFAAYNPVLVECTA